MHLIHLHFIVPGIYIYVHNCTFGFCKMLFPELHVATYLRMYIVGIYQSSINILSVYLVTKV